MIRDGRPAVDSIIPAGYTYFGQFVDHDITFDVSSTIESPQDANDDHQHADARRSTSTACMAGGPRSIPISIDSRARPIHRRPSSCSSAEPQRRHRWSAATAANAPAMPVNFDVPRVLNGTDTTVTAADSTFTAIIGDPRNDENVIVSQFHHAMLKFHNQVVDLLVTAAFPGDIFAEAKKIVTHHYQWCVVHDFLPRICGAAAVNAAIASVSAPSRQRVPHAGGVRGGGVSLRPQHDPERLHPELIAAAGGQHARGRLRFHPRPTAAVVLELGGRLQHVLQHRPPGRSELQQCAEDRQRSGERARGDSRRIWDHGDPGRRAICDAVSRWVCQAVRAPPPRWESRR